METIMESYQSIIIAISLLVLWEGCPSKVIAQTPESSVREAYVLIDNAKNMIQREQAAAKFRALAKQYPQNWIAQYYAAYTICIVSLDEKDGKKVNAELVESESYFQKIAKDTATQPEVSILGALIATAKITASPSSFRSNGSIRDKYLQAARLKNPENPRIYYLQGWSLFYTPRLFGGGAKKALPLFIRAAQLFAAESKADPLTPHWGALQNNDMIQQCKNQLQ